MELKQELVRQREQRREERTDTQMTERKEVEDGSPSSQTLTLLDAKAASPLIQSDVLVIVQVTGLEKAGGAVLHGDEGRTQWGQLSVGQVPVWRR